MALNHIPSPMGGARIPPEIDSENALVKLFQMMQVQGVQGVGGERLGSQEGSSAWACTPGEEFVHVFVDVFARCCAWRCT